MASDQPAFEDTLGLNPYFRGITKFIKECDTPMTIAIQGGWGTGKTSALAIIAQELISPTSENADAGRDDGLPIIWFGTWPFAVIGEDSRLLWYLTKSFEEATKGESQKDQSKAKKAAKKGATFLKAAMGSCVAFAKPLAWMATGNEAVGDMAANLLNMAPGADDIRSLAKSKTNTQSNINKILGIEKEENAPGDDPRRVVVFIDDLDRLEPIRALALLEGIKNFIDCEHCVFVLAVDDKVVREGIAAKYHFESNDEAKQYTQHFFDKIIQVPFRMRDDQYDITGYIEKEGLLGKNMPVDSSLLKRYARAIDSLDARNPRSIKRAFNLMRLYECMGGAYDDEERLMLFVILLTQMRYPDALNRMLEAYTFEDFDTFIENAPGQDEDEAVIRGIQSVQKALGGSYVPGDDDEESLVWDDKKSIEAFAKAIGRFANLERTPENAANDSAPHDAPAVPATTDELLDRLRADLAARGFTGKRKTTFDQTKYESRVDYTKAKSENEGEKKLTLSVSRPDRDISVYFYYKGAAVPKDLERLAKEGRLNAVLPVKNSKGEFGGFTIYKIKGQQLDLVKGIIEEFVGSR